MNERGRDRIHFESDTEKSMTEILGDAMAEAAWPGVFSGGKEIIASMKTTHGDMDVLSFRFNDGSEMNIVGKFDVRYKEPPKFKEREIEHGRQLMSGQLELDEGHGEG